MTKYIILIPSFNDWDCLNLLIPKIDEAINKTKDEIEVLIVNDGSSEKNILHFKAKVNLYLILVNLYFLLIDFRFF